MMFTRTVRLVVAQLLLTLLLSASVVSCVSPPEYPDKPSIEFKSAVATATSDGTQAAILLTLAFKDGTGDLGLDSLDIKQPPFQQFNPDGSVNRYFNNYFIKIFRRDTDGVFRSLNVEPGFDGRFDHLAPSDKAAPIRGDLRYTIAILYGIPIDGTLDGPTVRKGDVIRLEINITDRGLNESNVITTNPITLP
ncbi:hypothetical protein FY528_07530 [Hymenobacter lutimineralis]|uniref:DUF3823 domain-containing protein n=1 Tax=Hymenobacter lutimineralis TaxID=2606448 RepID=A0A5D6V6F6_9BACT|nr:hypothetical protein [Hymenobacter lutimineralis]TYZ10900.1 hypothetical protein FY528_07530 [Hymenobacter lutimineralis]